MTKEQLLNSIYSHPLITANDMTNLCDAHEKVVFRKGDYVLERGQTANEYFIVEKGLFRSSVFDVSGNDITTNFFSEGELVIEVVSLFQQIPTRENIQALTDSECWKIDFPLFQRLFHSIPGFSEWGRAWMAEQLFFFKQKYVETVSESATVRYLKLMKEKPQVIRQAPLKHIATYLGVTDTSLSRIRKEIL